MSGAASSRQKSRRDEQREEINGAAEQMRKRNEKSKVRTKSQQTKRSTLN
jgi:hypothetical protein